MRIPLTHVIHPEDVDCLLVAQRNLVDNRTGLAIVQPRTLRSDGAYIRCHFVVSLIRDKNAQPDLFHVVVGALARGVGGDPSLAGERDQLEATFDRAVQAIEVAAGIAHEINQPLTAIVNYLNTSTFILSGKVGDGDLAEIEALNRRTAEQALRAGDIVRRLREFISLSNTQRANYSVEQILDGALALALPGPEAQGIMVEQAPTIQGHVLIDHLQIQQSLANVLHNATEALATLPICEQRRLTVVSRIAPGGFVELSVGDNGPGVADAVRERLFDPFVTTKLGRMGMGLFVARRLVEAHGGSITHEPSESGGTIIRVLLPMAGDTNLRQS